MTTTPRLAHVAPLILLAPGLLPSAASAQQDGELPPRYRGLVHLGKGELGSHAEAAAAGMVVYDGRWLTKAQARRIPRWERAAKRIRDWDDAYKVSTKHYRIETDVPLHVVDLDIAPFLDALYRAYTEVFHQRFGLRGRATDKKFIRIYRSYEEYAVREAKGGKPRPRSNPAFIVNGSRLVTFWEDADPDRFYKSVCHEGAHQFVKGLLPGIDLPKWMDEGMATLFESCVWSSSRGVVSHRGNVPAKRLSVARRVLADAGTGDTAGLPRRLFLDVPDGSFHAREYALAATFVHYLTFRDGGGRAAAFARFLRELNGSGVKPVEEVWREATGSDFDAIASGWRDHVMEMDVPRVPRWCVVEPHDAGSLDVRRGDRISRVDGVPVFDEEHFQSLWRDRPTDQAFEIVLVRESDGPGDPGPSRGLVRVTVPAGARLTLTVTKTISRAVCRWD